MRGTRRADQIVADQNTVNLNGLTVEYSQVERLRIQGARGRDQIDIGDPDAERVDVVAQRNDRVRGSQDRRFRFNQGQNGSRRFSSDLRIGESVNSLDRLFRLSPEDADQEGFFN